jgi:uncharacterized protein YlzI (FlbEa/FlbD family)
MYIEINVSESRKRFINADMIVSIDVVKVPPNNDVMVTLSSGEVIVVKDETAKTAIIKLLDLT